MRHRKAGIKLNRTNSHRQAMFRNMVTSLFKYERIRTTDAKAKELRRWADHMITLAKRGDLHARRQALSIIREKAIVHKLFEEVQERFGGINGGYTRVVKLSNRPGDAAPISMIELVSLEAREKARKKKSRPEKVVDIEPDEPPETDAESPTDQTAAPDENEPAMADASVEDEAQSEPADQPDEAASDVRPEDAQQDELQESEEEEKPEK